MMLRKSILMAILMTSPAFAHESVSGWLYDAACCSDRDCKQINSRDVKFSQGSYRWNGYSVDVNSTKLRLSGDNEYHACINEHSKRLICFYVPQGGV